MEPLDKICEREHERIVYFGENCPLCFAYEMLGRVIDTANDVLKGLPAPKVVVRRSAPPKNLLVFRPREVKVNYPAAIDGADGAA